MSEPTCAMIGGPALSSERAGPRDSAGIKTRADRWSHVLAAAVLLIIPFVVYFPLWSPVGRITLGMDYPDFQPGQQLLFLQSVRDGYFPLWAPGDGGGTPFAAYFIAQQYSPVTWALGLFQATYDGLLLDLLTIWRLGLLGMSAYFGYLVVRRLGWSTSAGMAAGVVYVLNLRMLDCFRYGSGLDAAVWLPVLVWLADVIVERPRLRWLVCFAFAQHMLIVSGHFQNAFYIACFVIGWTVLRLWMSRSSAEGGPRVRWLATRLGCLAGGSMLGLGLSAGLLLPVVGQMMPLWTKRTLGGAAYYYEVHMTWRDLLCNLFYPWLADIHSAFYGSQGAWLLLVAAAGMLMVHRRRWPGSQVAVGVFALVALLFCVLYSLGPLTPVGPLFNAVVPGVKTFRAPGRLMIVGAFAMGLLVALAIDRAAHDPDTRKTFYRIGLIYGGLSLLAGGVLLAIWALGLVHWGETIREARALWLPVFGSITANAPARIHSQTGMIPLMAVMIIAVAGLNLAALFLFRSGRLTAVGLVMALGVGALVETAVYHRRGTYVTSGRTYMPHSAKFKDVDVYHARMFDRISLFSYAKRNPVKSVDETGSLRMKFDLPGPTCEFLADGGTPAWRMYFQNVQDHEIPRAYLTPTVRLVQADDLAAIRELDPYASSVLDLNDPANGSAEDDPAIASLAASPPSTGPADSRRVFDALNGEVQVDQFTPNRASFVVRSDRPVLFNYNDNYMPDWHATVDGRPATVYRVNHLFKGVTLPAGQHRVSFTYDPPSTWVGLRITLAAACVWIVLAGCSLVARRSGKILVTLLILGLTVPAAVHLDGLAHAMAYRDGVINFNPQADRAKVPDRDAFIQSFR